jgi:transcriptional regulator with XRE-family HTH domain
MKLTKDQLVDMLRGQTRQERVVTLRGLYGLSQTQLANIAKVARGTVSTWEAPVPDVEGGRGHEPSKTARSRLAAYFNLPAYVFTDEWGDPHVARKRKRRRPPPPERGAKIEPPPIPAASEPDTGSANIKQIG